MRGGPSTLSAEVIALRELLETQIQSERRVNEAHREGHAKEHVALALAVDTALNALRVSQAASNEWRATLGDRDKTFATQSDLSAVREKTIALEKQNERESGAASERQRQADRRMWAIGISIGVVSIIVSWLLTK